MFIVQLSYELIHLFRIANTDPKILPAPLPFIAQQNNFDCSKSITQDQINQPVATGYTIIFADPLNNTNVCPLVTFW